MPADASNDSWHEAGFSRVRRYGEAEHWLAVLATCTKHGAPAVSVINAGIISHPITSEPIIALVARGGTAKLRSLRSNPKCAVVFRHRWDWVAVHGRAQLAGPDDPFMSADRDDFPRLLRDIYRAAGGRHPDLDEYDRVMASEGRTAVLIRPDRFVTNPPGTEHQEHPTP